MTDDCFRNEYTVKIASLAEMNRKWDEEIARGGNDRENRIIWKKRHLESFRAGHLLPYYGFLGTSIICEATARIHPDGVQNSDGLVDAARKIVYLSAFRTVEAFQGQGYFSKLFRFMLCDLRQRGYVKATLGVEPAEEKNKQIYAHFGFTEYLKSGRERYPDGTEIEVEYYGKTL